MKAPPTPCTARPAISTPSVGASEQIAEPTANTADAGEEHPLATDLVGDLAADDEQRPEEDVVDGDDPRQVGAAGAVELAEDLGKGDVDDRQVERRDVGRAGAHDERQPRLARARARPAPA